MFATIVNTCKTLIKRVKNKIEKLTKPASPSLTFGSISDLPRSKADLMAENAILRQQVIVRNRQVKKPNSLPRTGREAPSCGIPTERLPNGHR